MFVSLFYFFFFIELNFFICLFNLARFRAVVFVVQWGHLKCSPSVQSFFCKLLTTTGFFALAVYLCTNARGVTLSRPLENWKALENMLQHKDIRKVMKLEDKVTHIILVMSFFAPVVCVMLQALHWSF